MNFTVHELKELREDRLLFYVLDQRNLRIAFAHLIAKRDLDSGLSPDLMMNTGTVPSIQAPYIVRRLRSHRLLTPRLLSLIPDLNSPRSVNPESSSSHGFCDEGRPAPHGSEALRSDKAGQEDPSHAFESEAPSLPHTPEPSRSLLSDEVRLLRDHVSAIEIALGLGPGGQAASQASKPATLEVLRQDLDALGRETHELHGHVDRRVPASALDELRRGLDALSHEVHGRMPSYEPQGYSFHSAYGYSSYPSSSPSVPSYPSYDSRGYQPVYHSQASTPVVQRTQPRFEEASSHLGLHPFEKEDPAGRDTA
ncbi:hypothetical protein PHPALM_28692 [Phytophthora palmivora]|uniref:Uncharacterized protein n=1 Tax=Phytophthora palmivora TaxID=4796 RepID=A0A2P4X9F1_9STRA|nr:hypothetical protein PHPALM_28692 [Phytophthora palmivora]